MSCHELTEGELIEQVCFNIIQVFTLGVQSGIFSVLEINRVMHVILLTFDS